MLTTEELKTEIPAHADYKDLDQKAWEAKIEYRAITHRSQYDFNNLKPMYTKKISALRERLAGEWDFNVKVSEDGKVLKSDADILDAVKAKMDDWYYANEKEKRLLDKLAVVLKEEQLREDGLVTRTDLHDQGVFYIDYGVAADDQDGSAPDSNAFKTISRYTTTTVRTAGDIAYVRANVTWPQGTLATDIDFDEDGTTDLYISIIGCDSVTNDPWGDASDVKPIVDLEDTTFQIELSGDDYWKIENIECMQGTNNTGQIRVASSFGAYIKDCKINDGGASSGPGLYGITSSILIENCEFIDCWGVAAYMYNAYCKIINSTFNKGAVRASTTGVQALNQSVIEVSDSSFGQTTAFVTYDVYADLYSRIYLRNCLTNSDHGVARQGKIYIEDEDGDFESHISYFMNGTITRATASARAGGADSYAVMVPNANCGVNNPLTLGNPMKGYARVWCTKDVEINIAVYARVGTAWDGALTAAQCYAKFSYLSNAASAARVELQSTETISNVADWTTGVHAFTSGAFTPLQTGWVYIWFNVAHWEDATEEVWVDIKPVVS